MTVGTLIRRYGTDIKTTDNTESCVSRETQQPEEKMRKELLEQEFGAEVYYKERDAYFADTRLFNYTAGGLAVSTSATDWDLTKVKIQEETLNIWDTPKLKRLLDEPVGTPISLTVEEADEIVRLAAGRRPDMPNGKKFVTEVRELLGHSMMERLKKARRRV